MQEDEKDREREERTSFVALKESELSSTEEKCAETWTTLQSSFYQTFAETTKLGDRQAMLEAEIEMQNRREDAVRNWENTLSSSHAKLKSPEADSKTTEVQKRKDVEAASHFLEAVADNGYPLDLGQVGDTQVKDQVLDRVGEWMNREGSQWLWMSGPIVTPSRLSEVSTAAYCAYLVSKRLNLPILSYRFRKDDFGIGGSTDPGSTDYRSTALDRFTAMVLAFIRQLVCLLPDNIEAKVDLSSARFQGLDASTQSILDAFNLLEDLLKTVSPMLVIVLDGFQLVDNDNFLWSETTAGYLDLFLQILRETGKGKVFKILLTSDGSCRTLMNEENLGVYEQVHFGL
ncbi:hypothetical protein BDV96DRAFT_646460 [Lophiotrema nucula]|uniref:Uncharacterized protein n=1 Tax=Lophiotrema nucula TaxID=690887 RepID=A0A6A5Z956_9PLEO|nr:hypothetical protein BDV96DRAFT_646460 [Lophiotrema nucula]